MFELICVSYRRERWLSIQIIRYTNKCIVYIIGHYNEMATCSDCHVTEWDVKKQCRRWARKNIKPRAIFDELGDLVNESVSLPWPKKTNRKKRKTKPNKTSSDLTEPYWTCGDCYQARSFGHVWKKKQNIILMMWRERFRLHSLEKQDWVYICTSYLGRH